MPLISIITPVYDTPEPVLRACIESVRSQSFTDWEFCLVDDCSPSGRPGEVLAEYARKDPRIRFERRERNGGIVAASNDSLAMARGEFVSFLDHDDELYDGALQLTVDAIHSAPDVDYVYTDEDKLDEHGNRFNPFFKPDWSPERFRYQMYTCHFGTMRRSLVEEVGGFRADYEGSQDFDLVFRVTERARTIVHVPEILYGWRMIAGSAAGDLEAKPYAYIAGQRAIQSHCDRVGFQAEVTHDPALPGRYGLVPRLEEHPSVSIVIPTDGRNELLRGEPTDLVVNCVESIVSRSTYPNYEIIVVADSSVPGSVIDRLRSSSGSATRVIQLDQQSSIPAKINAGVTRSDGEHVVMLGEDVEVITPGWLESLMMYSAHDPIGAVGPKLVSEDGRLQHVGISCAREDAGPMDLYRGFTEDHVGYFGCVEASMNLLAVSGSCLMTPRDAFDTVGGLSERFPVSYNDVDYCMKLREAGWRTAYDPEVKLYRFGSPEVERYASAEESIELDARWGRWRGNDPYCRAELTLGGTGLNPPYDYGLGLKRSAVLS